MDFELCLIFLVMLLNQPSTSIATALHKVTNFAKIARAKDCQDLWDAGLRTPGVYKILLSNSNVKKVYCLHDAEGTATIIQHRSRGDLSFYRGWHDYRSGFGDRAGDHWIGLDALHLMTSSGKLMLDIILEDWANNKRIMTYDSIHIGDESTNYRLLLGKAYGQLPDDMAFSNNSQFATWDHPDYYSCATHQLAGWWYNYCAYALLNGVYHYGGKYTPTGSYYNGIYWKDWHGYDYSLKTVTMTLRNR